MTRFHRANIILAGAVATSAAVPPRFAVWLLSANFLIYLFQVVRGVCSPTRQFFCRATVGGPTHRREVALTYDDGPDPRATPRLLDLLAAERVPAAFFVIGSKVRQHPDLVRRCHDEGHLVENHSDRHAWFTNFLFTNAMERELASCTASIVAATASRPRYFRPPFGVTNHATGAAVARLGLDVVGWQVRGLDTRGSTPKRVIARVLRRIKPGGIILLHDGGRDPEKVMKITRAILAGLRERNLEPVRLDALLAVAKAD